MPDDHAASIRTGGSVAVGGSAAGDIETARDRDWFAVELVAGRTYVFDLEGSPTGAGTLQDTYLRGIHDANGNWLSGTNNDDGGSGTNSRVTFTATESGTHYVAAGAYGSNTGTYELSVMDTTPEPDTTQQTTQQTQAPADADEVRAGATDLGDITGLAGPAFPTGAIDGGADAVDYFRFTLSEAKEVRFGLRQQETDADLLLEDEDGAVIASMTTGGTANEELPRTLLAGTYFVRIEAQEAGASTYVFRYGVDAPDRDEVARLQGTEQTSGQPNAVPDPTPADADAVRAGATDLGDITGLAGPAFPTGAIDGGADAVDYFRFTLSAAKDVHFGLRQQETDADSVPRGRGRHGHREHDHGRNRQRRAPAHAARGHVLRAHRGAGSGRQHLCLPLRRQRTGPGRGSPASGTDGNANRVRSAAAGAHRVRGAADGDERGVFRRYRHRGTCRAGRLDRQ